MTVTYYPKGVCSQKMEIEAENGVIRRVVVTGGCNGNLQGICKLAEGRKVEEIHDLLRGIRCGYKSTSCPDQLAIALEKLQKEEEK